LKNFYRSPFSKWSPQYRTNSTLFDFNNILHINNKICTYWYALSMNLSQYSSCEIS
jgi:hypothetical protein